MAQLFEGVAAYEAQLFAVENDSFNLCSTHGLLNAKRDSC
jgi:hypothetical protein